MSCTTAKMLADAFGWESPEDRRRKARAAKREAESEAFWAAQATKRDAENALRTADQQGVVQLRDAMSRLENDFRGASGRSSSPGARATQAESLNQSAQELESKAREARAQGLGSTAFAAESAATRMRSMARELTREAAGTGLRGALSGVASEYGSIVRDTVEEVLEVPPVPGRYTGETVRDYLESATDRAGTLVPLADSTGNYISGPMRQEVNRLLDSPHNLPRSPAQGGGYSAPAPPPSGGSWRATTPDGSEPEDWTVWCRHDNLLMLSGDRRMASRNRRLGGGNK